MYLTRVGAYLVWYGLKLKCVRVWLPFSSSLSSFVVVELRFFIGSVARRLISARFFKRLTGGFEYPRMQHRLASMDSVAKRSYLGKVALYSRKPQLSHGFLLRARNLNFMYFYLLILIEIRVIFV